MSRARSPAYAGGRTYRPFVVLGQLRDGWRTLKSTCAARRSSMAWTTPVVGALLRRVRAQPVVQVAEAVQRSDQEVVLMEELRRLLVHDIAAGCSATDGSSMPVVRDVAVNSGRTPAPAWARRLGMKGDLRHPAQRSAERAWFGLHHAVAFDLAMCRHVCIKQ